MKKQLKTKQNLLHKTRKVLLDHQILRRVIKRTAMELPLLTTKNQTQMLISMTLLFQKVKILQKMKLQKTLLQKMILFQTLYPEEPVQLTYQKELRMLVLSQEKSEKSECKKMKCEILFGFNNNYIFKVKKLRF